MNMMLFQKVIDLNLYIKKWIKTFTGDFSPCLFYFPSLQ